MKIFLRIGLDTNWRQIMSLLQNVQHYHQNVFQFKSFGTTIVIVCHIELYSVNICIVHMCERNFHSEGVQIFHILSNKAF